MREQETMGSGLVLRGQGDKDEMKTQLCAIFQESCSMCSSFDLPWVHVKQPDPNPLVDRR